MFTKQSQKDAKKIARAGLKKKAQLLLEVISVDPSRNSPPYEKLIGDCKKN